MHQTRLKLINHQFASKPIQQSKSMFQQNFDWTIIRTHDSCKRLLKNVKKLYLALGQTLLYSIFMGEQVFPNFLINHQPWAFMINLFVLTNDPARPIHNIGQIAPQIDGAVCALHLFHYALLFRISCSVQGLDQLLYVRVRAAT